MKHTFAGNIVLIVSGQRGRKWLGEELIKVAERGKSGACTKGGRIIIQVKTVTLSSSQNEVILKNKNSEKTQQRARKR